MKPLPYLVCAGLRGPDVESQGAEAWKVIVIAPLRWFTAKALGVDPNEWCFSGFVFPPPPFLSERNSLTLNRARSFTSTQYINEAHHVMSHAGDAYTALIAFTLEYDAALSCKIEEYKQVLTENDLLPRE